MFILLLCAVFMNSVIVTYANAGEQVTETNTIEITVPFHIPPLDLREYDFNFFEIEQWFLDKINTERELYGVHPYAIYAPATVIAIEHSLDMRNNNFGRNAASDGRTHQQRHDRWMGVSRTKVTSSHSSSHWIEGELTPQRVHEIVDSILSNELTHYFIMNPTYYYIGIGFSIQSNGRGRLNLTMASLPNERASHRARTLEQRAEHRQSELERIRNERGWTYEY